PIVPEPRPGDNAAGPLPLQERGSEERLPLDQLPRVRYTRETDQRRAVARASREWRPMSGLVVSDLSIRFGGIVALDGVSFAVEPRQVMGLIGPNGAGKTTVFNCVTRLYTPDTGAIRFEGADLL